MQRALTVQINIPSTVTGKEEESDHEDGEPDVSIDASNSINALGVPACKELTRPNFQLQFLPTHLVKFCYIP